MDTRTLRPTGGSSPGFDDEPALSMVKVPCDPAQVIVNHASFRVLLATPVTRRGALTDPAQFAGVGQQKRRTPVVWSGRTEPGDPAAGRLLQAVRNSSASLGMSGPDIGATQVLPRITAGSAPPTVIGPRNPSEGGLLRGMRPARGAYDDDRHEDDHGDERYQAYPDERYDDERYDDERYGDERYGDERADDFANESAAGYPAEHVRARRQGADAVRHAYYPGRRMNLGVVLLPLRIFLGLISVYAGLGKLSDPVYFDGGDRGSMVTWLASLQPWAVASPLRDFALAHPVGAGLTVAFLQVVIGVLTVLGLWQRVAASFGALLSAALLLTVSWRTVPVYDAPNIIYLAAWSPLVIAGAPVYSLDGRLAGEAWRKLGPRSEIWELRRRVLRRGTVIATVVVGLALLTGSMLGGAVRSSGTLTDPGTGDTPANNLPGSPLPTEPGGERTSKEPVSPGSGSPTARHSASPSAPATPSVPGSARETGGVGTGQDPGRSSAGARTPAEPAVPPAPPSHTGGPSSTGGSGSSGGTTGGGDSSGGGSDSGGALGGLLG